MFAKSRACLKNHGLRAVWRHHTSVNIRGDPLHSQDISLLDVLDIAEHRNPDYSIVSSSFSGLLTFEEKVWNRNRFDLYLHVRLSFRALASQNAPKRMQSCHRELGSMLFFSNVSNGERIEKVLNGRLASVAELLLRLSLLNS